MTKQSQMQAWIFDEVMHMTLEKVPKPECTAENDALVRITAVWGKYIHVLVFGKYSYVSESPNLFLLTRQGHEISTSIYRHNVRFAPLGFTILLCCLDMTATRFG